MQYTTYHVTTAINSAMSKFVLLVQTSDKKQKAPTILVIFEPIQVKINITVCEIQHVINAMISEPSDESKF